MFNLLFSFSENLVRVAFKCLQLVTTDFLSALPGTCYFLLVDVAAKFGLQHQELNVSLTSVGLLVSDVITNPISGPIRDCHAQHACSVLATVCVLS